MQSLASNHTTSLKEEAEARKHFSQPGTLGLSKLLDAKRVKHGIPDSAWNIQAAFNQVLIWQVPLEESKAYGEGLILKTDAAIRRELVEAPRGVIVSAGLIATDQLKSHGIDIGHTVVFTHLAPFRLRLPSIAGKEPVLVIVQAEYIFGSEDLAENLKSRKCRIVSKENPEGGNEHYYCDENGKVWKPQQVNTEQF